MFGDKNTNRFRQTQNICLGTIIECHVNLNLLDISVRINLDIELESKLVFSMF